MQGIATYPLKAGTVDVAITSVVCSKTVTAQGHLMLINVTVANEGSLNETFFVTVFANSTIVQRLAILALSSGNSSIVTSTWNTTDVSCGNYTISVVAETIQGEIDTTDNYFINGYVLVTIPGDVNGDRIVDIFDIGYISAHWYPGPPVGPLGYDYDYDLNSDGAIDIYDIGIVSSDWGQTW